jgi:alcohol dehydrogenase class IV
MADGKNEEARMNLQVAATMAGFSFAIASVALAHAMAHTVGMLHNIPHGTACGIMLPAVMRFNVDHATDKLAMVAQALGVNTAGMDNRQAALAAADEVEKMMREVGHPMKLSELGVPEESLQDCCLHAAGDLAGLFNPRPVAAPDEIYELYLQVF